jgi:hypothetical protein
MEKWGINKFLAALSTARFFAERQGQDLRDKARARRQKQLWRESGFVGGFEGPEYLSTNYKQYLAEYLDRKYPQHTSEK